MARTLSRICMDQPDMYGYHSSCSWSAKQEFFNSLFPFAPENLVSRDGFSRPIPRNARSFSTVRLNLVLTMARPVFCRDVPLHNRQPPSGHSRVYRVTQIIRTDGVHRRASTGTSSLILKAARVTDSLPIQETSWTTFERRSFPTPTTSGPVDMYDTV